MIMFDFHFKKSFHTVRFFPANFKGVIKQLFLFYKKKTTGTYQVLVYFLVLALFFGVMMVLFNCHLLTPVLYSLSCACISFWYYML
jgi:hypothetical protein